MSSPCRSIGVFFLFLLCCVAAVVCLLIKLTLTKLAENWVTAEVRCHQVNGTIMDKVLRDTDWLFPMSACLNDLWNSSHELRGKKRVCWWTWMWRLVSQLLEKNFRVLLVSVDVGHSMPVSFPEVPLPSLVLYSPSAKAASSQQVWWEERVLYSNMTGRL